MKMTKQEYKEYARQHMPRSNSFKNAINAFWTGGLICCIGQLLFNLYCYLGAEEESAMAEESISLIFLGALLTGLGVYDRIARIAGAGTLVPITGFANSVVSPALEFKTEGFITGVGTKMFSIAGPVIVYGISASVIYGIIYWLYLTL